MLVCEGRRRCWRGRKAGLRGRRVAKRGPSGNAGGCARTLGRGNYATLCAESHASFLVSVGECYAHRS